MRPILQALSVGALLLTIVPAVLVFLGKIPFENHAALMLAGTLLWFITASLWMGREEPKDNSV